MSTILGSNLKKVSHCIISVRLSMWLAYSCIFHRCYLLPIFPLLHFPPLLFAPAFSTPAFSTPAICSRFFHSYIFHPCCRLPHFPLLHFPPLHFWPYRIFHSRIFSRPVHATDRAGVEPIGRRLSLRPQADLWPNSHTKPGPPFTGLHSRDPCDYREYTICRPRRHGRLSWPGWLTDSGHLTYEVTCQP